MDNNTIVSEFTNMFRLNNKDNRQPKRFILKLLQDSASFLISQKWGERSLLNDINIYTRIECFEFEKINSKKCSNIEFRLCDILMRSKEPLPKLFFSKLGSSIRDIESLDGNYRFSFIDETQYKRNKKRRHSLNDEVYVFLDSDNHLLIPDHEIYTIDLTVLTPDKSSAEDCGCNGKKGGCKKSKYLDEFICPDKLLESVKDMTAQRLGLVRQIPADPNPNSLENA